MLQTTYLGLKTVDYIGEDSGVNVATTMDTIAGIQSSGDNKSNMWIIDDGVKAIHDELEEYKGLEKTIIVSATLQSSASSVDTYIATVSSLTAYTNDNIYLINFAVTNTNTTVRLNINLLGNMLIKKIDDTGATVDLAVGDIKPNVRYYYQVKATTVEGNTTYNLILIGEDYNGRINNTLTKNMTAKASIADADNISIADSAASNASKKVLFSVVKSTLKTYFDTLYSGLTHKSRHATGGADAIAPSDIGAEATLNTAIAKASIVDADNVAIIDSADSNKTKKITFANFVAVIKSAFDAVYTTALLKLTGYAKAVASSAIAVTDSINVALGKLEYKVDTNATAIEGKANSEHTHSANDIITGTVSIANGGTGASSAVDARSNLGAAATEHIHAATDITSGTLPIAQGGTGAATAAAARTALGAGAANGLATLDAAIKIPAAQASADIGTQITASRALALADAGRLTPVNSTSAITVTVPAHATVAFPIDAELELCRYNTGAVNIAAASGVTLRAPNNVKTIGVQYGGAYLKKIGTNEWLVRCDEG